MALRFLSPLHRATREIGLWFDEAGSGLATAEGHLLSYLVPYGPCPVSELVRVFGRKHSTMTSLLDRLEKRGLIERKPNPEDARSLLVSVTRRGAKEAEQVNALLERLEREIATRVTKADVAGFEKVIEAIGEVTKVKVRKR
jgi:DNA-binding MarR family transcriptional regulator